MTTTKKIEEELDLDDGPVLATDRLWPAPLLRKGPPPPPPGRRARGTAPLGEPITSGLIDVRAMAAAYAADLPPAPTPLDLAVGTRPLPLVDPEPEPAPLPELDLEAAPEPARAETAARRHRAVPLRRAAVIVAIGGTLVAGAALAGSLLIADDRSAETVAIAPAETSPARRLLDAPPLVIRADQTPPEAPLGVRVIPLPTTITEVATPAASTGAPARVRRSVRARPYARSGALAMRPSNSEIASAVVAVQRRLAACGDAHGMSGAVPIRIRVAPSGAVSSVSVARGTTRFRSCVASALERQRLPASQVGTTASFPVVIR